MLGLGILACLLSKANSQDIKYPTQTNVDTANNKNSTEITAYNVPYMIVLKKKMLEHIYLVHQSAQQ